MSGKHGACVLLLKRLGQWGEAFSLDSDWDSKTEIQNRFFHPLFLCFYMAERFQQQDPYESKCEIFKQFRSFLVHLFLYFPADLKSALNSIYFEINKNLFRGKKN
jgi:hypothetical protein